MIRYCLVENTSKCCCIPLLATVPSPWNVGFVDWASVSRKIFTDFLLTAYSSALKILQRSV